MLAQVGLVGGRSSSRVSLPVASSSSKASGLVVLAAPAPPRPPSCCGSSSSSASPPPLPDVSVVVVVVTFFSPGITASRGTLISNWIAVSCLTKRMGAAARGADRQVLRIVRQAGGRGQAGCQPDGVEDERLGLLDRVHHIEPAAGVAFEHIPEPVAIFQPVRG